MKTLNPKHVERLASVINSSPYFELISMKIREIGVGYAQAKVTDETGKILAHGTSTLMILQGQAPTADPPFPPKFLE